MEENNVYHTDQTYECDVDLKAICSEYEAKKVMEDMQTTIKEVEESEYYYIMVQQLRNNQNLRDNILHVLGSSGVLSDENEKEQQEHLQMVICALGSIQFDYTSQYQLAFAILLRRDFSHWIGEEIVSFDPQGTTPVDAEVMEGLGCNDINEQHLKRRLLSDRPTLLFMPQVPCSVIENILKENWRTSRLNKMVLFTNGLRNLYDENHVNHPRPYLKAILEHTVEYDNNAINTWRWLPFCNLKWHFFNLLTFDDDQLEAMLPQGIYHGKEEEEEEEEDIYEVQDKDRRKSSCLNLLRSGYRIESYMKNCPFYYQIESYMENCPSKLKLCTLQGHRYSISPAKREWCPPSTGWIKLNFSAAAVWNYKDGNREVAAGYGGIFHDENTERLHTYNNCSVYEEEEEEEQDDETVTTQSVLDLKNAEALREGLRLFIDLWYSTTTTTTTTTMHDKLKLVVEGDSIRIARWVSRIVPPPKNLVEVFKEIYDLLSSIDAHVVYHIYKEANSMAIDLANQVVAAECLNQS